MIQNLTLFILSSIVFILTPGLDTIFVVNKSLTESKKSGLVSAAGISFGVLFHTLFAALGLSIILAKSANAFILVKYMGAAYLIYLGLKALIQKGTVLNSVTVVGLNRTKLSKVFWMAALTNVLNPKVALFFLAFFPQFVKAGAEGSSRAFLFLGSLYAAMSLIWLAILSFFVSLFSDKIKASAKAQSIIQKVSGVAFIFLGIKIAISKK